MLKTVLDSLEGVDDAVQQFYAQTDDGTYVLQVEGVDQHPDVANLKSAYERTKADKQAAAQERDALRAKVNGLPEDFDPKEWEKLKKGGQADPQELVQLRQTLEAERDEWKTKFEELQGQTRKMTVERTLAETLAAQGVTNPTYQKAAAAMLGPQAQLDDKGNAVVDTDMGPMPLADHVKRWVASDLAADIYRAADIVGREQIGMIPSVMINAGSERAAQGDTVRAHVTQKPTLNTSYSPSMTIPEGDDQTVGNKTMTIDKVANVQIPWTGEDIRHVNNGAGFETIYGDQIAQAMRVITNQIESDVWSEVYANASRAVGSAGTTPFGSTFDVVAQIRQILADNGTPMDGQITLALNSAAG